MKNIFDRINLTNITCPLVPLILVFLFIGINALCGKDNTFTPDSVEYQIQSWSNTATPAHIGEVNQLFSKLSDQREHTIKGLINIFNDQKANKTAKLYAAYYLGAIGATEAIDSLAAQITLAPTGVTGGGLYVRESAWNHPSAENALVSIGIKSIPAMIKNLAESDDGEVRELSLRVICRIEGDEDIVRLRLEKAVKLKQDKQEQARLQTALKALTGMKF